MTSLSPVAVTELGRRSQTASPSPLARNPISLRLYKVLGASFDDEATREALSTLSELYSPSGSPALHPTEKQDDTGPCEVDEADVERIRDVPGFLQGAAPGDTAAKARKHLRRDIESKLEEGSLKLLAAFGSVDQVRIIIVLYRLRAAPHHPLQKLDALQTHITAMRARCEEAQAQLQSTNEACVSLLDRAGSLRDERYDSTDSFPPTTIPCLRQECADRK
jgi:conserved oligomeric Golgi complex subunit 6